MFDKTLSLNVYCMMMMTHHLNAIVLIHFWTSMNAHLFNNIVQCIELFINQKTINNKNVHAAE